MSESRQSENTLFGGLVGVDETCIGGKERHKHAGKKHFIKTLGLEAFWIDRE